MEQKPKSTRMSGFRRLTPINLAGLTPVDQLQSKRDLQNALEAEAHNCKVLSPSHPRDQAALLHAVIEALAEKDAEIAKLRAQITKDANRLDWAAGVVQPDHLRDQISAWAELARSALDGTL